MFSGDRLDNLALEATGTGGSPLVLEAQANHTYRISLGMSPDAISLGGFSFLSWPTFLRWGPTPVNNDRANASLVTSASGGAMFDLNHTTRGRGEPVDNVGHESLWWKWCAPTSGWYRFSIEGNPDWALLSLYPAQGDAVSMLEPLASSERTFLANGRVEATILARSGEHYHIRVAARPALPSTFDEPVEPSATLSWQAVSAPAYLYSLGTHTDIAPPGSMEAARSIEHPRNLVVHPNGARLFATAEARLVVFDRDPDGGQLSTATSFDADSNLATLNLDALKGSTLSWSKRHQRLFAFEERQSNVFALPPDGTSNWSRSEVSVAKDRPVNLPTFSTFAASPDGRFLYFADTLAPEIRVLAVNSESSIRRFQSVVSAQAADSTELQLDGLGVIGQMLVTPDNTHLIAAEEARLLIFSIDTTSGALSLEREIAAGGDLNASLGDDDPQPPLVNILPLHGLVLNQAEGLLFVSGRFAPQMAVFDVSEDYANPRHLGSLIDFPVGTSFVSSLLYPPSGHDLGECGRAYAHGSASAIDVFCDSGHFVALWDTNAQALRVTDYGYSGAEDRAGNLIPLHGDWLRQSASSPDGKHLYRATGADTPPESDGIHVFQRALALELAPSGNHAPAANRLLEDQVAIIGRAFSYQFANDTFVDADGDPLTYSTNPLPDWLFFNANSRRFSGTPSTLDGTNAPLVIMVTASDDQDSSTLQFGLEVRAAATTN